MRAKQWLKQTLLATRCELKPQGAPPLNRARTNQNGKGYYIIL